MSTASARPNKGFAFNTSAQRLHPEINVTPLVDVVLVLLIIFMVIAPQLEAGEPVELPAALHVDEKSDLDVVTLTLTPSGRSLIERDAVAEDELEARLKAEHEKTPEAQLVLKADHGVTYGRARKVFELAREVGFPGVSLTVDEKKAE